MMTVSKKFDLIRHTLGEMLYTLKLGDEEEILMMGYEKYSIVEVQDIQRQAYQALDVISRRICDAMSASPEKFRLPSPTNEQISPIVTDQLDTLIIRLARWHQGFKWLLK